MRGKKISRHIALVLAIAVLLSLFVAVLAMILTMGGCSQEAGAGFEAPISQAEVSQPTDLSLSTQATTHPSSKSPDPTTETVWSSAPSSLPSKPTVKIKTIPRTTSTITTTISPKPKPTTTPTKVISPKTPGAVAMTFDDGPGDHTARLLDALKDYDVKATFFVQGQFVEKYPHLILRMHQEGHQVANHTYSHAYLSKVDDKTRRSQLVRASDAIENVLGFRPNLMRPPGGYRSQAVYQEAGRQGMATVFWDIDTA
ncbi:MAG TPA: polysaccharide deacetylase family protein, partial [Clostridia bacterium]|nr:polysaccharide deacetylase family protein [Clostridia bacterium]